MRIRVYPRVVFFTRHRPAGEIIRPYPCPRARIATRIRARRVGYPRISAPAGKTAIPTADAIARQPRPPSHRDPRRSTPASRPPFSRTPTSGVFAALQSIPNPGISHSRRSPTQSRDPLSPPRLPPSSARHCLTVRLPIRRRRRSPHHHQSPFSPPSHLPELRLRRRRHYPFAVASPSPSSLLRPPWLHPSLQPSIPLSVSSAAPPLPLLPSPPRSMPPLLIDSIPAPLLLDLLFYQIYTAAPPSPLLLDIRRRSYLSSSTCSTPTLQLGSALESCSSTVTSTPCSQRDVHLTFAMEFKMLRNWRCSDLQSLQFSFILNFISASLSMVSFPIMLKTMSSCNRYILLGKEHDH